MGFHDYYWFFLEKEQEAVAQGAEQVFRELSVKKSWTNVLDSRMRAGWKRTCCRPMSKAAAGSAERRGRLQRIKVTDTIPLAVNTQGALIALLDVSYNEGAWKDICCRSPMQRATAQHS